MSKVKTEDLIKLAELYNSCGKQAVFESLKTQYQVNYPSAVFKRMCERPELGYNSETDIFQMSKTQDADNVFMSMEELCSPVVPQHISKETQHEVDNRPEAMDKLIQQLIGDRLLELSKYITIDSLSKRILVDKTTLMQDGYQLVMH